MKNKNLQTAKTKRNDEFYTQYEDIEKEMTHYTKAMQNKTIYCNCDNPKTSNFWKYFYQNFKKLRLKTLIATYYNANNESYATIYDGKTTYETKLSNNGDFRLCKNYIKKADIIITNPPFSLFTEFILLLEKYKKKYLIIGNINAITYKNIFPLIKENKLWLGYNKPKIFISPNGTKKIFGNTIWFTNLDIKKRKEILPIKQNDYNEVKYPKYNNCEAIEVNRTNQIPNDYNGIMGVPISFLNRYNPEQFEIIDISTMNQTGIQKPIGADFIKIYKEQGNKGHFSENMYYLSYFDKNGRAKIPYARILIKRRTIYETK